MNNASARTKSISQSETFDLFAILRDCPDLFKVGSSYLGKDTSNSEGWYKEFCISDKGIPVSIRIPRGTNENLLAILNDTLTCTLQSSSYQSKAQGQTSDELFQSLTSTDDEDERGELFGRLQELLRSYNKETIGVVVQGAMDTSNTVDTRRLSLQLIAGAKSKRLLPLVKVLIVNFFDANDHDLNFAAIACASHLPKEIANEIKPQLESLLNVVRFRAPIDALLKRIG